MVEPVYAQLGAMLATQAAFERRRGLPLYRGISDEEAYGPALRWYSGDWEVAPTDFTAARTQQALQPLASILNSGDDPGETDGRWLAAVRRFHTIGYKVIDAVSPPAQLPTTPDVLMYVELPDTSTVEGRSHHAAQRPRRALPHCDTGLAAAGHGRAVGAQRSGHHGVGQPTTQQSAGGRIPLPPEDEPAPDELAWRLRACGLSWGDLADQTEALTEALALADAEEWQPTPANLERTGQ